MNIHLREKIAIGSVAIAVLGTIVGEPVVSLFGALMMFAALTIPPQEQVNEDTDSHD